MSSVSKHLNIIVKYNQNKCILEAVITMVKAERVRQF